MHKESLTLVGVVLLPRLILNGDLLTVKTDHVSFTRLLTALDASHKLTGWRLRLSELEFNSMHLAGIRHKVESVLAKLRTIGSEKYKLDNEMLV